MDRITKFLGRLSHDEQAQVTETIERILAHDITGFDIRKLKGQKQVYRVRIGDIRIIYAKEKSIRIIAIERRNDNTYR